MRWRASKMRETCNKWRKRTIFYCSSSLENGASGRCPGYEQKMNLCEAMRGPALTRSSLSVTENLQSPQKDGIDNEQAQLRKVRRDFDLRGRGRRGWDQQIPCCMGVALAGMSPHRGDTRPWAAVDGPEKVAVWASRRDLSQTLSARWERWEMLLWQG